MYFHEKEISLILNIKCLTEMRCLFPDWNLDNETKTVGSGF